MASGEDRMQRFLSTSLGIQDTENYDLKFDLIRKVKDKVNTFDMFIVKNTPWFFPYLEQFVLGLEKIDYTANLHFTYLEKPTIDDALKLFVDWHYFHYRIRSQFVAFAVGNIIKIEYEKPEDQKIVDDIAKSFTDFLKFLNYEYDVESSLNVVEQPIEEIKPVEEVKPGSKKADKNELSQEDLTEDEQMIVDLAREQMRQMRNHMETYHRKDQSWKDRIYYKPIEDLSTINEYSGNIQIEGELFGIDKAKTMRNGATMLNLGIGRGEYAFNMKIIENEHLPADVIKGLKNGTWARVKGYVDREKYTNNPYIDVRNLEKIDPPAARSDDEEEKRVELHLHTKMSVMDGVSSIKDYMRVVKSMGHKALAITDHGVVQAFPDAQNEGKANDVKILYGSELYMVNDELPFVLNPVDVELNKATFVVFDLETTGLSTRYDKITEFGAIRFENGRVVDSIDMFINPERPIPLKIIQKTKITNEMVKDAPTIEQAMDKILDFIKDSILVSHNITFDYGFLNQNLIRMGKGALVQPAIDTLSLSHYLFPEANYHNLGSLSKNLGLDIYDEDAAHRADQDARVLNDVWLAMLTKLTKDNHHLKHSDLAKIKTTEAMLKHLRSSHVTALAKNEAGVKDLFDLITISNTTYLADVPKTPKREIKNLRENLLIGSGCLNGEIFDIERTRSKEDLLEAMSFYDFIEVQPPENYVYLINRGVCYNMDEIKKYIRDIIACADELGKPVVATGDVHYANPEDKVTRDIYIEAPAVGGKPHPLFIRNGNYEAPNQHYRSTREMLDAFSFLGDKKAKEIVVKNSNLIADSIEKMEPIHDILCKPEIPNSEQILIDTCFGKARELYGDDLPKDIEERLNKEIAGINGNGYSVTYYIANQIVQKAAQDGYMVGSRGSVGSSLAAHLYGITEVNPLAPHYRCPKCKHFEYSEDPNYYSGSDLPEKKCPVCGAKMVHDGQDIPFETFLGFHAEKVPDIDLNFPSDYQAKAHDFTKDVFGEHNVFRAGTIETVATKTAFGYVRRYFEQKLHIDPNEIPSARIAYMASHCVDVKRTTGQHPGGIVVLPKGRSMSEFTPVQYPADDKESNWLTTHFDYHPALEPQLLKLDLLGHVDPLALRLMSLLTGVDVKKIPLNDSKVISLFTTNKALKMDGNYLKSKTGASGLPEFGTETCGDILVKAKPKSFADVVAVAGLAHGTNVWQHNEDELIRSGTMTLHDCIACRDDIMKYLIAHGVPSDIAFDTMEKVRKGKKIPPKHLPVLKEHNIPEFYINACNKIEYLYPKAHAVAYATMAVRVGYFKVYYPLEFYAVWFSARCKAFDIVSMLGGKEAVINKYDEINRKLNSRLEKSTPKDKDLYNMLKVAIEMTERGYKFENVDLYKSDATNFIVDKENNSLIPPFIVIDGLGENAAQSVIEARKDGDFKSKEDLLRRTKLNGTNVENLDSIGALNGLGESDQMSIFEFGFDA